LPFKVVPPGYQSWQCMKQRCSNPKAKAWPDYGGRGITVCDRWFNSYADFISDMGYPPEGMSIERINNNLGYFPENCKWATRSEQQLNRRNNVVLVIEGIDHKLYDLVKISGMNPRTIKRRVAKGLGYAEVTNSTKKTYAEWSKIGRQVLIDKAKAKTHCSKGHEFTEKNRMPHPRGWNICRICHNAKARRYSAAKRLLDNH